MAVSTPIYNNVWAALSKLEASYGAGAAVTAGADAQLLADRCVVATSFNDMGARTASAGTTGQVPNVAPSGKVAKTKLTVEGRGLGAAYGASAFPPDLYLWLQASGHLATLSTGTYVFTPQSVPAAGYKSAYLELYGDGMKFPITGALADLVWRGEKTGVSLFDFDFSGIMGTEAEAAVPAATYLAPTIYPPKANNIALAIGAYTVLRAVHSFVFKVNRKIAERTDQQSGGTSGFAFGDRAPTLELNIEREALGTFNPFADRDAGTQKAITLALNGGSNNKINFNAAQAQCTKIENVTLSDAVAGLKLTYELKTSSSVTDDDYSLTWAS